MLKSMFQVIFTLKKLKEQANKLLYIFVLCNNLTKVIIR